jgi:hypothetical protein
VLLVAFHGTCILLASRLVWSGCGAECDAGASCGRYEQKAFPEEEKRGRLRLIASPDGADGSVTIHTDARVFAGESH